MRESLGRENLFLAISLVWLLPILFAPRAESQEAAPSAVSATTSAQISVQSTVNPLDVSVFTPLATATLGQQDTAASAEIAAYRSVIGGSSRWLGMQATGTIRFSADPTEYNVTLSNLGNQRFRLDTQTPAGVESIRIQGRLGKVQIGNKPAAVMDPDTALTGIFPFELVGRVPPGAKNTALVDHGTVSINGTSLHWLTLELPSVAWNPSSRSQGTLPVDLYFSPTTHLLIRSACYVILPGGRQVPFLSVVTYSDYRFVGTSMVPFHYAENINGQLYRTVQFSSVQLNPALSPDYFHF